MKRSHASNGNTISINRADKTTEWSSIPDEVEIKVEVADVESGDTLTTVFIKGRSGIATVGRGDQPQDLLPEPVGEFVSSLY